MYANYTASGWSNATCISDLYGWNDHPSYNPSIVVDNNSNVHVVWADGTWGEWGIDDEIMYANYTASGWSNATVISDNTGWNDGPSINPSIAVESNGKIHVVWEDWTWGEWGVDNEIMYANYTAAGWSNATAISDLYGWNDGDSSYPSIAVDGSGIVHVVWWDETDGEWGNDDEIMYANYTSAGWSNATAISDFFGWNNGFSLTPSVASDNRGKAHVVWEDWTNGEWGNDEEIMYAVINERPSSNNPSDIITTTMGPDTIDWVIWDDTGEGQYRVWVYDIIKKSYYLWVNWTVWTNNTNLNIPINRSIVGVGVFNYTIEFYDIYQQYGISDSVIVTITDYIPTKDEPIIIAPQGGGDISSLLLSPLGLGIIAGVGVMFLIMVAVIINKNKTIEELKKTSKPTTSKKAIEK